MPVQANYVESLFANLENGNGGAFFEHVADDVDWTVMGTHPLAGTYHTKADFLAHTFARLDKILEEGVVLRVTNVLIDGDSAAVEMESLSTALNGKPFDNRYCWIVHFSEGTIVEVRAYLDSALVQRLIDENEPPAS
jgi:ketosteroid isomerase-like protein